MTPGLRAITLAIALAAGLTLAAEPSAGQAEGWPQHGRDAGATRYSPLDQIDRSTVADLQLAWVAPLGFVGPAQGAPAVWGDALVVSTEEGLRVLDATTGSLRWQYSEGAGARTASGIPRQAPRGSPVIVIGDDGRVVVIAALPHEPVVIALDLADGVARWRTSVARPEYAEALRTNPILAGDVVVVGPTGADLSPVPGRLVALRVADGSIAWSFDLVPVQEDDPARSSWLPVGPGRATGIGGGSAWNAGAYDAATATVIYGTGQPVPSDRLDPRRHQPDGAVSADLYTASFVALDARTGRLRWFHQVVPGDEWEYDQHTVPMVVELDLGERGTSRVALLATTTGYVVLVDVDTGAFLAAHAMVDGATVHVGYDPAGTPRIASEARRSSPDELVQVCPGRRWASVAPAAFSPRTALLYRPNDLACVRQGSGTTPDDWRPGARPIWLLAEARAPEDHVERWGALTAIDPVTGRVAWSFDLAYPHDAGALATAGDLVFSAFADRFFRAFDAWTGEVLWSAPLTAHADGAPITYAVDGTQYVAVVAGRATAAASLPASGLPPTLTGPATLLVFALPIPPSR
jgi:PQQ-dependent dehydrogenase (methanol/ethanol family)